MVIQPRKKGLKESNIRVGTIDCTKQAVYNFNDEIIRAQNYV